MRSWTAASRRKAVELLKRKPGERLLSPAMLQQALLNGQYRVVLLEKTGE